MKRENRILAAAWGTAFALLSNPCPHNAIVVLGLGTLFGLVCVAVDKLTN